jgi:hypothetical protein
MALVDLPMYAWPLRAERDGVLPARAASAARADPLRQRRCYV